MEIVFHGHSALSIVTQNHHLLIDPFLTGNPLAQVKPDELSPDFILLTHGHNDHLGDTVAIAKRSGATVITSHELANWLGWQGIETIGFSIGGTIQMDWGTVKAYPAIHGNGYIDEEKQEIIYMGPPMGMLLTIEGKRIYHAGDTALFSDLQLVRGDQPLDLAFLPIGDHFTMGPSDAIQAAKWLQAERVVPVHYDTFPPIRQDADAFIQALAESGIQGTKLAIGETLSL